MILCACIFVCVCVVHAWGWGGGVPACAHNRGCVLMIHEMDTADTEILSTHRFQALSLLRDDVHWRILSTL